MEFLTDNTLGRIWYEMTQGETALVDMCRYLVRRPVAALIGMREYDDFLRWRAQQELRGLGQAMAEQAMRAGLEEEDLAAALETDRRAVYDAHYRSQAGE